MRQRELKPSYADFFSKIYPTTHSNRPLDSVSVSTFAVMCSTGPMILTVRLGKTHFSRSICSPVKKCLVSLKWYDRWAIWWYQENATWTWKKTVSSNPTLLYIYRQLLKMSNNFSLIWLKTIQQIACVAETANNDVCRKKTKKISAAFINENSRFLFVLKLGKLTFIKVSTRRAMNHLPNTEFIPTDF